MHKFPSPDLWLTHRVCYGETDCMGVVYYAQYLFFFERARNAYIRMLGMSYADVEKKGILLPVRDVQCRYRFPARFDDLLQIHVGVSAWGKASLCFIYEIWDENKERLLNTGSTTHAVINKAGKPQAMPDWFRNLQNFSAKQ